MKKEALTVATYAVWNKGIKKGKQQNPSKVRNSGGTGGKLAILQSACR